MDDIEQDQLASAPPASLGAEVPVCRALPQAITFRATEDGEGEDGSPGTLVGHFSVFDEWYEINSWFEGHFLERISPGAFKRTIKNRSGQSPIRVLLEHGFDPVVGDKPLGVHSVLTEDGRGGYAEVPLFDTSYNRDLAPALRAGAYGQSFRFQVIRDEWNEEPEPSDHNPKGIPERTIKEVRVIEHGPTVFPASPSTNETTGLRSTTDDFYERLRSRQPDTYAELVARSAAIRLPQTPPPTAPAVAQEDSNTEDPPTRHSEDSPEQERQDVAPAEHSDDPPTSHSAANRSVQTQEGNLMDEENMTVEERQARQTEITARCTEIDNDYRGSVLPEDIQEEWDTLRAEYDEHDEAIRAASERQQYLADLAARQQGENPRSQGSRFSRSAPAGSGSTARRPGPDNVYDLTDYRRRARSVDDLGDLYKDGARRVIEAGTFAGVRSREAAQEHAMRLLDSVDDKNGTLARRIIATGSPAYQRAFGKAVMSGNTDTLTTEERAALSTTANAGGYAVPFDLDPTVILTSSGVINPLRGVSRVVQVVGNTWQGLTNAGITVSRSAEATQVGDNSPGAFDQPDVKVERVTGFIPFSMEIEQDWSALRSEMTTMLQDAKDTEEADSFLNGDGTSPNAEGLLSTAAGISVVKLGAGSTLAAGDLYGIEEALPPRYRTMARWLGNRSFFNTVRSLGEDSDGGNLWVRLGQGLPPELIGYPIHEASEMPALALGTDDSPLAVFGDFRQFLIVDKVGMNVELVPHLMGANQRPTGQRGILAVWRNNCKTLVPGAFRVLGGNDGV